MVTAIFNRYLLKSSSLRRVSPQQFPAARSPYIIAAFNSKDNTAILNLTNLIKCFKFISGSISAA
jgi:hypothetical protein